MDTLLKETIRIARLAGLKIKEMRDSGSLTEGLKDGVELVTNADLAAHDIIRNEILRLYPDHDILSEEDSVQGTHALLGSTWIVDPIDGTVNYANGHFMSAISIAYAENRKTRVGVVYNPFLDELFYAAENTGAFLNGHPIHVKDASRLNECLVATGFPYVRDTVPDIVRRLESVLPHVRDIRRLGSAALDICWVACGRLQGYYEASLHIWDAAAGLLIAKEAGAAIGQFKEDPENPLPVGLRSDNLIVTSPGVFDELKALLM
jgi:myo-inositol-1(or 4)-monophosphatase